MENYFNTLDNVLYTYAHKPVRTIRKKMREALKDRHDVVGGWRYLVDIWKKDRIHGYDWGSSTPKPIIHPDLFRRI